MKPRRWNLKFINIILIINFIAGSLWPPTIWNFSQTRFQSAFSPTSNFGRENSKDFTTALQSERGCKEATARETKSDSKRDKEEEEQQQTGDYIFACKIHLLHYQFL